MMKNKCSKWILSGSCLLALAACGQGDIWEPDSDLNILSSKDCAAHGFGEDCSLEDDLALVESDTWVNTGHGVNPFSSEAPLSSEGGEPGFSSEGGNSQPGFSSEGG